MATEHSAITDPEIHEPKGIAAAAADKVYLSDGAGSGSWVFLPNGSLYYDNIGTGTTISGPTSYTLIGPATTAGADPKEISHNSLGRLTYSGTPTLDFVVNATVSFKHSVGSGQDCYFQLHKNGSAVAGTQHVVSADSANYQTISLCANLSLSSTDYVELFCKVASGNIVIHSYNLVAEGKL